MAIEIRSTDSTADPSLSQGDFSNPLNLTFNGSMGGEQEQTLWLKNNSGSSTSVEIDITGEAASAPYEVYLRKLPEDAWAQDPISFADISANASEVFYLKVEISPDTEVGNFTNLKIEVTES